MNKRTRDVVMAVIMAVGLSFSLGSVLDAKLRVGPLMGYYAPNFGEINSDFRQFNDAYGSDLELGSGLCYGVAAEYELSPNFCFRAEVLNFNSETSASGMQEWYEVYYYYYEYWYDLYIFYTDNARLKGKVQVTPIFLNAIYKFSPEQSFTPYLGVGAGTLLSNCRFNWSGTVAAEYWLYDWWYDLWYYWYADALSYSFSDGDSGNPIAFQILAGLDLQASPNLSFAIQGRYIAGKADLEMPTYAGLDIARTTIDWGGFFLGATLEIGV